MRLDETSNQVTASTVSPAYTTEKNKSETVSYITDKRGTSQPYINH